MPTLPAQPNQSLVDGLACLQALATAREPIGSRELARKLQLEPTRVNRLLKTLAAIGIARQDADKRYVSGPGMHVLAAQAMFGSGLIRRALPSLQQLRSLGLTVAMGVLWRTDVCYLYNAPASVSPAEGVGRTALFPATRSSIGMSQLARLPEEELRALYEGFSEIPRYPGPDGTGRLLRDLALVREQGFAIVQTYEGKPEQTLAVAIPGEPASVAVSGLLEGHSIQALTAELEAAVQGIITN